MKPRSSSIIARQYSLGHSLSRKPRTVSRRASCSSLNVNSTVRSYFRGSRIALSARMFFWTSVVPAPIDV